MPNVKPMEQLDDNVREYLTRYRTMLSGSLKRAHRAKDQVLDELRKVDLEIHDLTSEYHKTDRRLAMITVIPAKEPRAKKARSSKKDPMAELVTILKGCTPTEKATILAMLDKQGQK